MSGAMLSSYRVESAAEREIRLRRTEWQRFVRAQGAYAALCAEAAAARSAYGAGVLKLPAAPAVKATAKSADIAAAADKLTEMTATLRDALRDSIRRAAAARVPGRA
jgi:hypothetical protein